MYYKMRNMFEKYRFRHRIYKDQFVQENNANDYLKNKM